MQFVTILLLTWEDLIMIVSTCIAETNSAWTDEYTVPHELSSYLTIYILELYTCVHLLHIQAHADHLLDHHE
jgi:hypothetical protein